DSGVFNGSHSNYEKAIVYYTNYINAHSQDAGAYYARALCYQAIGDKPNAQADFEKAKQLGFNG
ncbi:MAG: hypothetical protein IJ797_05565, partial [Selenomonadaceae bacterium]|nr:hypothetical protein [Selenomonadaceae bacterium]